MAGSIPRHMPPIRKTSVTEKSFIHRRLENEGIKSIKGIIKDLDIYLVTNTDKVIPTIVRNTLSFFDKVSSNIWSSFLRVNTETISDDFTFSSTLLSLPKAPFMVIRNGEPALCPTIVNRNDEFIADLNKWAHDFGDRRWNYSFLVGSAVREPMWLGYDVVNYEQPTPDHFLVKYQRVGKTDTLVIDLDLSVAQRDATELHDRVDQINKEKEDKQSE